MLSTTTTTTTTRSRQVQEPVDEPTRAPQTLATSSQGWKTVSHYARHDAILTKCTETGGGREVQAWQGGLREAAWRFFAWAGVFPSDGL